MIETQHERQAYENGRADALSAAGWVTDGNDTDESRRRKLKQIDDDGVDAVMTRPNLSGEFEGGLTPQRLFADVMGVTPEESDVGDLGNVMDALCEAYEIGVAEAFEGAVVLELKRWLGG